MKHQLTFIAFLFIVIFSCKKDGTPSNTPTKTIEELLTEKTWKVDELRIQLSNNTIEYYKRGGSANTVNYDSDSLKFNIDYTGIYYYLGEQYSTTWDFIGSDKSKMTLVINYPTPITINLENINITETYLKYAQYSTSAPITYLASGTRIPN